jgi:hypothetical protein
MTTVHTVVRSGKSKRKPFNSNVADYLLVVDLRLLLATMDVLATEVLAVSIHLTELIRYMRQWNGKPSRSRCARTTKLRVLSSESVANRFRGRRADLDGSTRGNSDLDVRPGRRGITRPAQADFDGESVRA